MLGALGAAAPVALAQRVLVLGPHGRVQTRDDPFVSAAAIAPPRAVAVRSRGARPAAAAGSQPTVRSTLLRLYRQGAISAAAYRSYSSGFNSALAAEKRLHGTRALELEAVTENLHGIAAARMLTPSRLPALFETVARNLQWWTTAPLPSPGQLIEFAGSQLVWEYYAGQGLELQELASFSKADGLYTAGASSYPAMRELLSELIPLAADRGGGLVWEYYFHFDGGAPPWTSAMSQGTALEALTRAYAAFGDPYYLQVATGALPIFSAGPPTGVREATTAGARYLQYTFAPGVFILNAFLQSLIGLFDFAQVSGNTQAAALFAAGDAEARAEVPGYDTGAWSLYQPGLEDTLSYHLLVTGFLQQLCSRTQAPVYCTTAQRFTAYLKTPPVVTLLTHRARKGRQLTVGFQLSKVSRVGIVIVRGAQTVFLTSAPFPYGRHSFTAPAMRMPGTYTVRLAATDLAGNFSRTVGTLQIS
jgi:hypothetical protein